MRFLFLLSVLFWVGVSTNALSDGLVSEATQKINLIENLDDLYSVRSALEKRISGQENLAGTVRLNYNSDCKGDLGCLMFYVIFDDDDKSTVISYPRSSNPCEVIEEANHLIGKTVDGVVDVNNYPNGSIPWKVDGELIRSVWINYEYASGKGFSVYSQKPLVFSDCGRLTKYLANRRAFEECVARGEDKSRCSYQANLLHKY